jgi:small basic protein
MNENPDHIIAINLTQDAAPLTEPKYKEVGGWLLFFCLTLTVFSPLITIISLLSAYSGSDRVVDRYPGLMVITDIDTFLSLGLMAFSVYAGVGLWRVTLGAVRTAKRYLLCLLAYAVVATILPFIAGLPSKVNEAMVEFVFIGSFRTAVYVAIWYAYLNKSARVKATFES